MHAFTGTVHLQKVPGQWTSGEASGKANATREDRAPRRAADKNKEEQFQLWFATAKFPPGRRKLGHQSDAAVPLQRTAKRGESATLDVQEVEQRVRGAADAEHDGQIFRKHQGNQDLGDILEN